MNSSNVDDISCDCCGKVIKTNIFVPSESSFKKNYIQNNEETVCFECLGFYLYETYVKNSSEAEKSSLIIDIKNIKNELHNFDTEEDICELDGKIFVEERKG